jgi:hypothetical protein
MVAADDDGPRSGRRVVEVAADDLARAVAEAQPDDVIVALDRRRARLLAPPPAVLAAVDRLDGGVVAEGASIVGCAGVLSAWLEAAGAVSTLPGDRAGVVFHRLGADGATVVVHGRLLDTAGGTEPLVAVSDDAAALAALDAALADMGGRDLARILRYDDAIAHGPAVLVAPEIVSMAFWTPAFCATVVRAAEATGAFGADPEDPVPGHELSLAALSPRLFAHVEDDIAVRVMPALMGTWPAIEYAGLRDAFVIKFTPGGQAELPLHHDVAQVSASVRLNDGYGGGALEFPRQGFTNATTPVGGLVAWPSLVTHPHRSAPVRRGVKYSLTIWLELPHQQ